MLVPITIHMCPIIKHKCLNYHSNVSLLPLISDSLVLILCGVTKCSHVTLYNLMCDLTTTTCDLITNHCVHICPYYKSLFSHVSLLQSLCSYMCPYCNHCAHIYALIINCYSFVLIPGPLTICA